MLVQSEPRAWEWASWAIWRTSTSVAQASEARCLAILPHAWPSCPMAGHARPAHAVLGLQCCVVTCNDGPHAVCQPLHGLCSVGPCCAVMMWCSGNVAWWEVAWLEPELQQVPDEVTDSAPGCDALPPGPPCVPLGPVLLSPEPLCPSLCLLHWASSPPPVPPDPAVQLHGSCEGVAGAGA